MRRRSLLALPLAWAILAAACGSEPTVPAARPSMDSADGGIYIGSGARDDTASAGQSGPAVASPSEAGE